MLSVKQGDIKHRFLSFWYDSTWDWTQVSQTIGKHSNYYTKIVENFQEFYDLVWYVDCYMYKQF